MPDSPQSKILLGDADAFFVAVARQVDPEGAGKAPFLIVGGRERGVVCSASYEARQMGVRSAMPIARAKRLCPQALCVPVPRGACTERSRAIRTVLGRFSPVVQAASIDEWYVDLTGTDALYHGAELASIAREMRRAVHQETELHVSFGGGPNKLIAKLAVERAKPKPGTTANGVFVVPPDGVAEFLATVTLADIPMIGPRFRDRLATLGMVTVPDVLPYSERDLSRMLGERAAGWLYRRVRGQDLGRVTQRELAKSLSHEETFSRDIASDEELERELVRLVTRVAHDLRTKGLTTRTISVKLRDADFRTRGASRTLAGPVIADRPILAAARALLHKLRRSRRVPTRLLGVAATGLDEPDGEMQLALFETMAEASGETAKDRALVTAVDKVRKKFGSSSLGPGVLSGESKGR